MLEISEAPDVVTIAFAHGKVNALDLELLDATADAFRSRAADPRPIVLTGVGRAFSAGVDLARIVDGGAPYVGKFLPALSEAFLAVFEHPAPVVAAVNGHALAGGCIFAAACDLRVMVLGPATIGVTELAVGVPFPITPLEILRHACGDVLAAQLVYTARRVPAREAQEIGLVHELVDADQLLPRATLLARQLGGYGRVAYTTAKQDLRRESLERITRHGEEHDARVADVWSSPEVHAGMQRYLDDLAASRSSR